MHKNILLVVGITALFLGTCITPIVAIDNVNISSYPTSDKSVIIVDDEGDGDYLRIKDALNHVNPGDTIEVYSGTYNEYDIDIEIEEVTLKGIPYELGNGYDTGKPLIHGRGLGKVMRIWAQGFTITGFRIENGGGTIACGIIGTRKGADNCVISDNDIAHAITGCVGIISDNNKIINNNISHSVMRRGIGLGEECKNNIISGNIISDVVSGILFWDSNHNTVIGNKISRCKEFGIDIASSNFNTVKGNTFEDNTVGVHNYYSFGCRIINNNFIDNQVQAQFFYAFPVIIGYTNRWRGNYWGEPRSSPFLIRGVYFIFPWVQFDWFPAKEPYDIGV